MKKFDHIQLPNADSYKKLKDLLMKYTVKG